MARTLTRSGGEAQVTPDTSLARRFELPFSWDVPVSESTQKFPLISRPGNPGIFDQVDLELQLVGDHPKLSSPIIHYGGRRLYTVNRDMDDYPRRGSGMRGTGLWTITSKMTCPSFSLPAGATTEGGTCVAANTGKTGGKREAGQTFICDGCYSLEGQYIYPNVATSQGARQAWVIQELKKDPSGELLGHQLGLAIEDYARNATLRGSSKGMAERITQEIGVWDGRQIMAPAYIPAFDRIEQVPCFPTQLPPQIGASDTREWFARRGVSPGQIAGFFRIHDSGDFTVGSAVLWAGYVNAWVHAARMLPHVIFWAPTRLWILPRVNKQLRAQLSSTPNLIVRPSALHVNQAAPTIQGMANGTTVASVRGKKGHKEFTQTHDMKGSPCYTCPVYLLDSGKSCMGAGCRACWIAPELAVAYGWH